MERKIAETIVLHFGNIISAKRYAEMIVRINGPLASQYSSVLEELKEMEKGK